MIEKIIESLDYFSNEGNRKLEQKLRVFLAELDKDLTKAEYVMPTDVSKALDELHEALEDVIDFMEENDLTEEEVVSGEDEDEDEDGDDDIVGIIDDDDDDSEAP